RCWEASTDVPVTGLLRAVMAAALAIGVACLPGTASAQQGWYAIYSEGVNAFARKDYALAERRLLEALANPRVTSRRGRFVVPTAGSPVGDEFMPEFYLARIAATQQRWGVALIYAREAERYMRGD